MKKQTTLFHTIISAVISALLCMTILSVLSTDTARADLNHYDPGEDPDEPDPCEPSGDGGDPDECPSSSSAGSSPDGGNQGDQGCDANDAGDPFSLHSGKFELTKTYLEQSGLDMTLSLRLYYSSFLNVHSAVGYGWTHNFNMRLRETSQGRLVWVDNEGSLIFFNPVAGEANSYISDDIWEIKAKFASGVYTVTKVNGTQYVFDSEGRLTEKISPEGIKHVVSYAAVGDTVSKHPVSCIPRNSNLTTVTTVVRDYRVHKVEEFLANGNATGRYLQFDYMADSGLLDRVQDQAGRVIDVTHDAENYGNLSTLTETVAAGETLSSHYTYYMAATNTAYYGYMETFSREGCSDCTTRKNYYYDATNSAPGSYAYAGWVSRQTQGDDEEGEDISVSYATEASTHTVTLTHNISSYDQATSRVSNIGSWQEKLVYMRDSNDNRRVRSRTKLRPNVADSAYPDATGDLTLSYVYYGEDAADQHGVDGAYLGRVKTKTDYNGTETTYTYYENNGLVKTDTKKISDTVDLVTAYEYDALNNMTMKTQTQSDRSESIVTEYEFYTGTYLMRYEKQKKGNNDYLITEYTYYPSGDASENLVKDIIKRNNGTVLSTTRHEYTTAADAPQPIGLLKKVYDLDDPAYVTSYHYTAEGYRDVVTDALGNTTETDRDGTGRVTELRIKDSSGNLLRKTINTYTGSNLTEVKVGNDTEGYRITRYGYDSLNRQSETIRVTTNTAGEEVEELQSSLNYRSDGAVLMVTNALDQTTSYQYGDNSQAWPTSVETPWKKSGYYTYNATTKTWYDENGRAYLTQEAGGTLTHREYDGIGRITRIRFAYGTDEERMVEMDHDVLGNVVERRVYGVDAGVETLVGTTYYYFDNIGRKIGTNWSPSNNKQGDFELPSKVSYDDENRSFTTTDGENNSTTLISDRFGRTIRAQFADRADYLTDRPADGNDVTRVYDVLGNMIQTTDGRGLHRYLKYDAFNRITHTSIQTDQDWSATSWWNTAANVTAEVLLYSAWDEALETLDVDRALSTATYDSFGRLESRGRTGAPTVSYDYTALDLVETVNYPAQLDDASNEIHPATSASYVYDEINGSLLRSMTDRAGNTTAYTYTNRFQRETIRSSLNAVSPKYTTMTYDVYGRVKTSKNELNEVTTLDYDVLGNVLNIYHPDHPYSGGLPNTASTVGVESFTYTDYNQVEQHTGTGTYPIEYTYDLVGNMQSMRDNKSQGGGAQFSGGTSTYWSYDARNRVERKYYAYQSASNFGDDLAYTYNANGALETRRDGNGTVTTYEYEPSRDLLAKVDYPTDVDHVFINDKAGRRTQMTDATGITQWSYDSLGRLETYTQNSVGQSVHYGYDSWSRINERRVRPVGTAEGSADEWLTEYSYDDAGRLQDLTDHKVSTTTPFTYTWNDNASLIASISFPSGARQDKAYDDLGRLKLIEAYNQANVKINSFDYDYNSVNQREQVTLVDGHKIDYTYDEKRQLDTAKKKDASNVQVTGYDFDYDFDAIGNRTSATQLNGETFTYTPNALNQYSLIDPSSGTAANPSYDDNGSLLSDGRITNTWNEENRLKVIIDSEKNTRSEYLYDGNGRRIERNDYNGTTSTTAIKTTRYLYEGWNCIADYEVQNSTFILEKSYTWSMDLSGTMQGAGGVGGLLAITTDTGVSHEVTYDGNGNVSDLLDVTGTVTAHYEYDPFGNTIAQSGYFADENTYRFSTKPMNNHAGELYYYGYRYYDPVTGRWPSRDPIEEQGGLNVYGFVDNDSINGIDVLGLAQPCCNDNPYDPKTECCIKGATVSRNEKITVKVCNRPANFKGGNTLSKAGVNHQFVVGPDGVPVGQGPVGTGGNPGPSLPGVKTELTDHTGEPQDDCKEYEVSRCAFYENTKLGTPTGRWIPGCNDCNVIANRIITASGGGPSIPDFTGILQSSGLPIN